VTLEKEIMMLKQKVEEHERRISSLEKSIKRKSKKATSKKLTTEDLLLELKNEGFFSVERTISQIKDALHAKGKIVKLTDLPPYLLKLVRNNMLKREHKIIGKKKVWVYFV
jgi:hypothetical protein